MNAIPKIDPKTNQFDHEEVAAYLGASSPEAARTNFKQVFVGVFDTKVVCVCSKEDCTVMDAANVRHDPYARLGGFVDSHPALEHSYYGVKCGLSYSATAFVHLYDYLPHELRRCGWTKRSDLMKDS